VPRTDGKQARRRPGLSLDGATVVITGASRGIGRAVAVQAARRGARVGLIARSAADLEKVRGQIGATSATAPADVADRDQVGAAIRSLEEALGPTDVLVANAGIGAYGAFADIPLDEVERLVRVNLLGTVYPLKAVLPGMLERGRGHLVVVSSVAGRFGSPFEAAYAATKFAQTGMAEAMSVELEGRGVGVSIVNPGVVDTDFFETRGHAYDRPFPKPISADRVAGAVVGAVESGRREVFVPRWFKYALAVRHLSPGLYAHGTRRSFKDQL
jgi:short-subunit dehydrogenase